MATTIIALTEVVVPICRMLPANDESIIACNNTYDILWICISLRRGGTSCCRKRHLLNDFRKSYRVFGHTILHTPTMVMQMAQNGLPFVGPHSMAIGVGAGNRQEHMAGPDDGLVCKYGPWAAVATDHPARRTPSNNKAARAKERFGNTGGNK